MTGRRAQSAGQGKEYFPQWRRADRGRRHLAVLAIRQQVEADHLKRVQSEA
jgi:hypothetical protein